MARVLIVDDEKRIRKTLSEFIKEDGHEVFTAADADEAFRILRQDRIDIVVTDIILPRVTGVTLLGWIREADPDVQVIVITGEPTVDTAAAAVRAGAFDYLAKPIARDEIRAVIASSARVKALADDLVASGVEDLEAYLCAHPEIVDECIRGNRIEDVNRATLAMYGASTKEELYARLTEGIAPETREQSIASLVDMARGSATHERMTVKRRIDGTPIRVAVRWAVAPGYEKTFRRVLVSNVDMTARVEAEQALRQALDGTIEAIGLTTEMRDPYTSGHQRRVTALAVAIARELGLDAERIEGIRAAGLMHDVGKMAIPAEILSKPSQLTPMEVALIEAHPRIACDILKSVSFPWPVADIVLQHHERMDGSGYPQRLSGDAIRIEARVLAVADVVEAMASHRPYRAARGIQAALAEIEAGRGAFYDAPAVDMCLRLFREGRFQFIDEP